MGRENDRGDAVTETVIVVGLLVVFILAVLQFVVWGHATHVAQAAATEAARAARIAGGSAADGEETGQSFIAQAGSSMVLDPVVTVRLDAEAARAEVRGRVPRLVPFLSLKVQAVSEGPRERFQPATTAAGP